MKELFNIKGVLTIVAFSVCLSQLQTQSFAQLNQSGQKLLADSSNGRGANTGSDADSVTNATTTNAEVLKELQQMRARIAELEAKLKTQQGGTPTLVDAGVTNAQPAAAGVSSSAANQPLTTQDSEAQVQSPKQE